MKIFDTHTHYDDEKFGDFGSSDRAALLHRLINEENVLGAVGVGVDIPSSQRQIALAEKVTPFYAACGFHPGNIPKVGDVDEELEKLSGLLEHPKAVAIGEIGLDYYWEQNPARPVQMLWFEKQMELSVKKDLPVIVHDREAHGDCFDAICRHKGVRGVFHSYSGSWEMARELIKRDFMLSFTGVVTFKNAQRVAEVVSKVPMEYIMLETDCPYMAPVPMRGKVNHSGYLCYIAQKIAEIKNMETDEVVQAANSNASKFFNIKL